MAIELKDYQIADDLYLNQVSSQVQKTTAELKDLEKLLAAGLVERHVISEFRDAVNKIRATSWAVQQSMESPASSPATVTNSISAERVRVANEIAKQLDSDLSTNPQSFQTDDLKRLRSALTLLLVKLDAAAS